MKRIIDYLVIISLLVLAACESSEGMDVENIPVKVVGVDLVFPANLRDSILSYYTAEDNSAWPVTYNLRSAAFKRLVPFDTYKKEMEKGVSGWDLTQVEIVSVLTNEPDMKVFKVRFFERINGSVSSKYYSGRIQAGKIVSTDEEVIWKLEDKSWICVQPGSRLHLPLNEQMVF